MIVFFTGINLVTVSTGYTSLFSRKPRYYKDVGINSFFSRTARLCNFVEVECFLLTYDLNGFQSRISRSLLTVISSQRDFVYSLIFFALPFIVTPCFVALRLKTCALLYIVYEEVFQKLWIMVLFPNFQNFHNFPIQSIRWRNYDLANWLWYVRKFIL